MTSEQSGFPFSLGPWCFGVCISAWLFSIVTINGNNNSTIRKQIVSLYNDRNHYETWIEMYIQQDNKLCSHRFMQFVFWQNYAEDNLMSHCVKKMSWWWVIISFDCLFFNNKHAALPKIIHKQVTKRVNLMNFWIDILKLCSHAQDVFLFVCSTVRIKKGNPFSKAHSSKVN